MLRDAATALGGNILVRNAPRGSCAPRACVDVVTLTGASRRWRSGGQVRSAYCLHATEAMWSDRSAPSRRPMRAKLVPLPASEIIRAA